MSAEHLFDRLAAPAGVRPAYDWSAVRSRIGYDVPRDFTEIVDRYGDVLFCGVLRLLHPSPFESTDIVATSLLARQTVGDPDIVDLPVDLGDTVSLEPSSIVQWGESVAGDHFMWQPQAGLGADVWPIVVASVDQTAWHVYNGDVGDFLCDWMDSAIDGDDPIVRADRWLTDDGAPFVEFISVENDHTSRVVARVDWE